MFETLKESSIKSLPELRKLADYLSKEIKIYDPVIDKDKQIDIVVNLGQLNVLRNAVLFRLEKTEMSLGYNIGYYDGRPGKIDEKQNELDVLGFNMTDPVSPTTALNHSD